MSQLTDRDQQQIEVRAQEIGREIFSALPQQRPHLMQRRWWDDRIMSFSMRDEKLKVQLFRFVDVLPMLDTSEEVVGHLHEYLRQVQDALPSSIRVALGVARRTPGVRAAVAKSARLAAQDFARRFIAGSNVKEVIAAARRERDLGRGFTLDILGEAVTSESEAEGYFQAYQDLIRDVSPTVNAWEDVPQIDRGAEDRLPRMNLSIKLSALDCHFDAMDFEGTTDRVAERLRALLRVAREHHAFINVDMESYDKKDVTLHVFKMVLQEDEFRDVVDVGIVIQCYLRDADPDLVDLRDWAAQRGKPVWVRLVKGAYWDYETINAKYHGWPIPVWQEKWQSDANYERATRFVLQNIDHLRPALGSHNIRSLAAGIATAEFLGIPDAALEVQMLYGMADAQKQVLVDRGRRVRVYMPYGELIPGMAYLVRRLLENTSNDSFLRISLSDDVDVDTLLKKPATSVPAESRDDPPSPSNDEPPDMTLTTNALSQFKNQPPVDFTQLENREAMAVALAEVRDQCGQLYPLMIDGKEVPSAGHLESVDPSQTDRVVGKVAMASEDNARSAVAAAKRAWPAWAKTSPEKRAELLQAAAQAMRDRHFELAAWTVYECGKPWREATADIDEAIDFCEYYAAGAIDLFSGGQIDTPGEENRLVYHPRGVAAVISPWNFPLAILTGMTVAALATGNTVVMKPAEQSSVIAAKLMQIFVDSGFPPGVVNFLPGEGETLGPILVEHPDVALIAFTGSRQVGLAIQQSAAAASTTGGNHIKKVIAELGGKNAIIVDEDADLDEAVLGTAKSAFGYAGQKCSACSRVIVHHSVYDRYIQRLIDASRSLHVGPADDPATQVGPVVDAESLAKIRHYIDIGRQEGREVLAVDVGDLAEVGNFVGPHIFADIAPDARLAQQEVFGPVLALMKCDDLDQALAIANGTDYALTGGIYSRSPANIEQASREFLVGNLYINRNITGALVGRQPFGGFRMSGIGSKAGGPEYLLQFVVPRTITENTMRCGFAPPEES